MIERSIRRSRSLRQRIAHDDGGGYRRKRHREAMPAEILRLPAHFLEGQLENLRVFGVLGQCTTCLAPIDVQYLGREW